jgi:hypothetical protein
MLKLITAAALAIAAFSQPAFAQQETNRWTALAERDWADLPVAA